MISGFDKYFQIVRCFRDEDLRADRAPEFTQLDMEMSFIERDDLFSLIEDLMTYLFKEVLGIEIEKPFPRYDYNDVMSKYGIDKPDLRYGMEIQDPVSYTHLDVYKRQLPNSTVPRVKTRKMTISIRVNCIRYNYDVSTSIFRDRKW